MIRPEDILFWGGGNVLAKYGTLVRRTSPIAEPVVSFSRASDAWAIGRDGRLRKVASHRPRVEWLDSATPAVLLEGGRTNGIRNPRGEGAVLGTLGSGGALPTFWAPDTTAGLTWEVVATGVEDGLPYVDVRLHGTPSQTFAQLRFEGTTTVAAAPGQTWTGTIYSRLVAGSMAGIGEARVRIQERSGAGVALGQSQTAFDPADVSRLAFARRAHTRVMADPTTGAVVLMLGLGGLTVGESIDITLRIAAPQLEQSPVASSLVLPPSGAPAASARSADLLTAPWTRAPGPLAIYVRAEERGGVMLPDFVSLVLIGAGGDRLQIQTDPGDGHYQLRYSSGGTNQFRTLPVAPALGQSFELLVTLSADGTARLAQSIEGGPATSVTATPLALPAAWGAQTITVGGQVALRDLLVLDGSGSWTLDAVRRLVG